MISNLESWYKNLLIFPKTHSVKFMYYVTLLSGFNINATITLQVLWRLLIIVAYPEISHTTSEESRAVIKVVKFAILFYIDIIFNELDFGNITLLNDKNFCTYIDTSYYCWREKDGREIKSLSHLKSFLLRCQCEGKSLF